MTSLLSVTNEWLCDIDEWLINAVLFLDIKKAFDTINHEILLTKLKYYGFQEQSLLWIKSYLKERKQFCRLSHNTSSVRSIHLLELLDKVSSWLMANKLTLNITKTEYMIIGSKHNLAKIEKDPIILIRKNKVQRVRN